MQVALPSNRYFQSEHKGTAPATQVAICKWQLLLVSAISWVTFALKKDSFGVLSPNLGTPKVAGYIMTSQSSAHGDVFCPTASHSFPEPPSQPRPAALLNRE